MTDDESNCRKEVCRECPFRRKCLPGYLGEASYDPHGFIGPHYHGNVRLPCHLQINWSERNQKKKDKQINEAPLCRGFLIFMKNNCKFAENDEAREAMKHVEKDTDNIFQWFSEFVQHHSKKEKDDGKDK